VVEARAETAVARRSAHLFRARVRDVVNSADKFGGFAHCLCWFVTVTF
jgi:hypothetical protein